MSLRKIALILGISPTYLSLILSGRRPWRGNLKERYLELVNTFVNTPEANAQITNASNRNLYLKSGAEGGIRTHTPLREADFKSPKAHSPSGNVRLVNSFVSDRRLRGLSPRTCQFYEG